QSTSMIAIASCLSQINRFAQLPGFSLIGRYKTGTHQSHWFDHIAERNNHVASGCFDSTVRGTGESLEDLLPAEPSLTPIAALNYPQVALRILHPLLQLDEPVVEHPDHPILSLQERRASSLTARVMLDHALFTPSLASIFGNDSVDTNCS